MYLPINYLFRFYKSAAKIRFFIETAKNFWDFLSKRRKGKGMEREKDEDEGVS